MTKDITWTVGNVRIDWTTNTTPPEQPGETVELECALSKDGPSDIPSSDPKQRYDVLRDYLRYAHAVDTGRSHDGSAWFYGQTPASDPVDSHVVAVEPGVDVADARPFWGVVIGGTDETMPVSSDPHLRRLTLEIVRLAPLDEYDTVDAVEAAFSDAPV